MSEFLDAALKKLDGEFKSGSYDKYASAMKKAVRETIETFCKQDEEFAQAVAQGGSFSDCMKAVAKNCGSSISDLEAYRRAVQFYFPGAEIRWTMTVDLIGTAGDPSAALRSARDDRRDENKAGIILDFTQFL